MQLPRPHLRNLLVAGLSVVLQTSDSNIVFNRVSFEPRLKTSQLPLCPSNQRPNGPLRLPTVIP